MLFILVFLINALDFNETFASERDLKGFVVEAEQAAQLEKKAIQTLVDQAKSAMVLSEHQQIERHRTGSCPVRGCTALKASTKDVKKTFPLLEAKKSLIFVSSSMPIESLKRLAYQAKQHDAILVIRGMVNGSMHETARLVDTIDHPLEIDPKLFERFGIQQVPVFIVPHHHAWHTVAGNVELTFALEKARHVKENSQ